MLILFDVDATLITTGGVGIHAMGRAGRELFGEHFNERSVEYAGRLDPLIIADLLDAHDQPHHHAHDFRAAYRNHLEQLLAEVADDARPCPGVTELLAALAPLRDEITLGLLTGNFPETGRLKLHAAGINTDDFHVHVWGSDSPHQPPARDHLPPVALQRYHQHHGRELPAESVVIIGDTVHDIACALAHGCRALGVATGRYSEDDLHAAGAHRTAPDLSRTEGILQWLTTPTPA